MREKWARRIVFFTSLLVLLLAVIFALTQNPTITPDTIDRSVKTPHINPLESVTLDPKRFEDGREVYKQQACARCHSIAGKGNLRNPLDNVGVKYTADELRNWIIGADTLQGSVPKSVLTLKKTYRELPGHDLDALVAYLQNLRPESNQFRLNPIN